MLGAYRQVILLGIGALRSQYPDRGADSYCQACQNQFTDKDLPTILDGRAIVFHVEQNATRSVKFT